MRYQFVDRGTFGMAVRACHESKAGGVTCNTAERVDPSMDEATLIAAGQTDLDFVVRTATDSGGTSVAAFLCGRYLVVSPCFGPGASCPACFSKRFLSSPPPGLTPETVLAMTHCAGVQSGFDVPAFAPALPQLAVALLIKQSVTRSPVSILVDQAGMRHLSAPLIPIHGCACRGKGRGPERFISFYRELF
jgi:hypothetical protein